MPSIPLIDVGGNTGTEPPAQIDNELPKLNVGIMFGVIVTVNVAGTAHWLPTGVNVYTPEAWSLTVAGFQLPITPLSEVVGNAGIELPAHAVSEVPKLNVGVKIGFTVTVNVAVVAHSPAVGINK